MEAKWRDRFKFTKNLKLEDQYLMINFKQLFTFKMLWLVFKVCFCLKFCLQFLAFALENSGWLSSYLSRGYYEKGKSKCFWGNMGLVLGRLVSSTFDQKKTAPHPEFSPGTVKLLWRYCQGIIFFINLDLDLGRDMKKELDISLVRCWRCSQYNMSGIL